MCLRGIGSLGGGTKDVASLGFSALICRGQLSQPPAAFRMGRSMGSADPTQLSFKRLRRVSGAKRRWVGVSRPELPHQQLSGLVNDWRWWFWWWWCTCILGAAVLSPPQPLTPLTPQVHVEHICQLSNVSYEMVVCVCVIDPLINKQFKKDQTRPLIA